jgi:hypothetical protein
MNTVKYAYLLSALLLLLLKTSASAEDNDDYSPLKIGDEWIMDVVTKTPKEIKCALIVRITHTMDRDGKQYFAQQRITESKSIAQGMDVFVRKDETGIYSIDQANNHGKEQADIQLPFVVGKEWTRYVGSNEGKETEIGIETIAVGGKTYEKCFHVRVETNDRSFRLDFWQAPNVGQIKAEASIAGLKSTMTMREFKPAKD